MIEGDTSRPRVWDRLTGLLNETLTSASGLGVPITQLAVDSGYAATEVYQWARKHSRGGELNRVGSLPGETTAGNRRPHGSAGDSGDTISGCSGRTTGVASAAPGCSETDMESVLKGGCQWSRCRVT